MNKSVKQKNIRRERRQIKVRSKIFGTATRPRLSVFRSLKHISAQIIDDSVSKTLVAANDSEIKSKPKASKSDLALAVGKLLAKKAVEKKITQVVFDRGFYKYHGRVKAVADSAREGGLKF